VGRQAEALPVAEEAVAIGRELAAANPDRYRPALADSLSTLAEILVSLGRTADADPPGLRELTGAVRCPAHLAHFGTALA
jgi:hypothetical protein